MEMDVDAYAIVTGRYVVLCDTLLCPEDMAAAIDDLQADLAERQLLVINSHADWDHCWGNGYFTGKYTAPIIGHEHCRTRMQSPEAQNQLIEYQQDYTCFHNVVLKPPTTTFTDTMTIHGGDLTLELLHTPGHQPDHIATWIPELHLLLAFDAAEMPFPLLESPAGMPDMLTTLERLQALKPQYVLCAHGKTTDPALLEINRAYFREIECRSKNLLATRHPDEQELARADELIHYSFENAIADLNMPVDEVFYRTAHLNNIRNVIHWLTQA